MIVRDNTLAARATHLRGIFGGLEKLGYDIEALIAPFGLDRASVEDKDASTPTGVCAAVLAKAIELRKVKNLPLRLALETPVGSNPLLDYLVASSETVGKGLDRLARYLHLASPGTSLLLEHQQDPVRFVIQNPTDQFRVELTVCLAVIRLHAETGGRMKVLRVHFRHQPDDVAEFEQVLRCPVETGASWNGFVFPRESWDLPLLHSDPILHEWLEQKANQLLARQPQQQGIALRVRQVLADLMAGGDMSIQAAARRLAMAPRTLQRRLAEEGATFDTLRDITRKEAAEAFLSEGKLSIGEIAYLLGFSEAGAFHRAFKRWHSCTPQAFRQQSGHLVLSKSS
jgi:AraC-like DNA-binding protein